MTGLPKISIIMPVLNEEKHLATTLDSLISNNYPNELLEIIALDGGSTDLTLAILERYTRAYGFIRTVTNPDKTVPYALNLGVSLAEYDIVMRVDAHAVYSQGYIQNCVESLLQGKGDNVGGVVTSLPNTSEFSKSVAALLNSPLGNGRAKYRSAAVSQKVDTVFCGCWFKSTLNELGEFRTDWRTNQDSEYCCRMVSAGKSIYLNVDAQVGLVVRDTLRALTRQYFWYGFGRVKTLRLYPRLIQLRQVIPVLTFIVGLLAFCFLPQISLAVVAVSLIVLTVSIRSFSSRGEQSSLTLSGAFLSSIAFVAINVSWSLGFLYGLCAWGFDKLRSF